MHRCFRPIRCFQIALLSVASSALFAQQSLDTYFARPSALDSSWARSEALLKATLRGVEGFFLGGFVYPPGNRPYFGIGNTPDRLDYASFFGETVGTNDLIDVPNVLRAGLVAPRLTLAKRNSICLTLCPPGSPNVRNVWTFDDAFSFGPPVRRKAWDGGEFDASPMVHRRNGEPWLTVYWGYRMGAVESQFDWNESRLRTLPEFDGWPSFADSNYEVALKTLPLPISEGTVTEYANTNDFPTSPGGVFFYAATDAEREALDSEATGRWQRTGKSFFHGGFVQVCRFYGSVSPGPNTYFYTASDLECSFLKSMQVKPRPTDRQQLNYEGVAFYANSPIRSGNGSSPTCPIGSMPLYRAYNAAYTAQGKRNYDSNHRYSNDPADIAQVVALGWIDEGVAMCVPSRKPCLPLGSVCEAG